MGLFKTGTNLNLPPKLYSPLCQKPAIADRVIFYLYFHLSNILECGLLQILQISQMVAIFSSKLSFLVKIEVHMSYLNVFPPWMVTTWVFKLCFCVKCLRQMSHLNVFPSWIVAIWRFRLEFRANVKGHQSHCNVFSSWILVTCCFKWWLCLKLA